MKIPGNNLLCPRPTGNESEVQSLATTVVKLLCNRTNRLYGLPAADEQSGAHHQEGFGALFDYTNGNTRPWGKRPAIDREGNAKETGVCVGAFAC